MRIFQKERIISIILLCVFILCGNAYAKAYDPDPTVYEVLKAVLTDESFEEIIGSPKLYASDQDNGICWLYFRGHLGNVELIGFDSSETAHCLFWSDIPEINVLIACNAICSVWDELEEYADLYGHGLAILVTYGEDGGRYIFTHDDAEEFMEWFSENY